MSTEALNPETFKLLFQLVSLGQMVEVNSADDITDYLNQMQTIETWLFKHASAENLIDKHWFSLDPASNMYSATTALQKDVAVSFGVCMKAIQEGDIF